MQDAALIEKPQKKRADTASILVLPEPANDTVGSSLVLDLQHDPLPGLISEFTILGNDTVEPGPLEAREPITSHVGCRGARCHVDRVFYMLEQIFQLRTPIGEGLLQEAPIVKGQ
jgi:hypothetical protein